ncbi:MAG: Rpn family recombination-promoting nuclease/putative transposase [Bacteroidales bacterium]|nr:Rpn family recombination-promoting nuclease/putative transposase [Bacteroidales bacterium]
MKTTRSGKEKEWTPMSPEVLQVGRYVDVLSDSGFKAVFGDESNKEILRMMLNEFLPDGVRIRSMDFSTVEIPGLTMESKGIRIDLRCKGEDGTEFIIEMQKYEQDNFFKRCVAYSSRVYDANLRRLSREEKETIRSRRAIEDMEYDLKPVYFIALMAVDFAHERPEMWKDRFVSEYTFREKITGEVVCETISIIFVELKHFRKRLEECTDSREEWMYALKNAGSTDKIPEKLTRDGVRKFFEACELAGFSNGKRQEFETNRMREIDYYSIISTAKRRGIEKGREEGRKEGREEGEVTGREKGRAEMTLELAKTMKAKGMSTADIAEITGLTEQAIENL